MKRFFDIFISFLFLLVFSPLLLVVAITIYFVDKTPPLFWSKRVGVNNTTFMMPKFRTMRMNTPQLATHLIKGEDYVTALGKFLRKTSIDELPQFWSVFVGDMSLVGPRPALFNQDDLIEKRTQLGIHLLIPGLTGWAQINGRDEISLEKKIELDFDYYQKRSFLFDLKIMFLTALKVIFKKDIAH